MNKITLKIDGMACSMCESHINACLRREFQIKKISSSHGKGETVMLCEEIPDEEKIKQVIGAIGYTVLSVRAEPYEKKGLFGFRK